MVVSTVSALSAPAVPPHSGCFIQKTWADSPCLTPVCFHSASVSKLSPTSWNQEGETNVEQASTDTSAFVPRSSLFFFVAKVIVRSFVLRDGRGGSVCLNLSHVRPLINCIKLQYAALSFWRILQRNTRVWEKLYLLISVGPDNCLCYSPPWLRGLGSIVQSVPRSVCPGPAHPFRGRLQTYTGSPVLGKPLTTQPPTAVSNCHHCVR